MNEFFTGVAPHDHRWNGLSVTRVITIPRRQMSRLMTKPTVKMVCAPSDDSDQPGHPPSLIRVFAVRMKKDWVLSYPTHNEDSVSSLGAQSFCWFLREAAQIWYSGSVMKLPTPCIRVSFNSLKWDRLNVDHQCQIPIFWLNKQISKIKYLNLLPEGKFLNSSK